MKYYLAYGSNLNRAQMFVRCPGAKPVGTAVINGYKLLFKGSQSGSYLPIEKDPKGKVPVAVWAINRDHEKALDLYEGYPTFYYKKNMRVTLDSGEDLDAFVYIMHEDRKVGVPSMRYMQVCTDGYRSFGFDKKYLQRALDRSRKECSKWEL